MQGWRHSRRVHAINGVTHMHVAFYIDRSYAKLQGLKWCGLALVWSSDLTVSYMLVLPFQAWD